MSALERKKREGKIIIRDGFLGEGERDCVKHVHTLLGDVGQDVRGGSMEAALLFVNSCTLELLWND